MRVMKPIEIFRTGAHAPEITVGELADIASNYNSANHEAPVTKGHPLDNGPAHGWVGDVFVKGNSLYATLNQIDDGLLGEVRKGHYKKISASFYKPDAPTNPTPGQYSLRHVGFLGAAPPAVKGMRPAQFKDDQPDHYLTYEFNDNQNGDINMNDDNTKFMGQLLGSLLSAFGRGQPSKEAAPQSVDNTDTPRPAAATSQESTDLAEREAELAKREAAIKEAEAKAARADSTNYVESLVKEGKMLPAHKETVISLLESINAKDTVAFDDNGSTITKSKMDAVKIFLDTLPKQVEYSEVATSDKETATKPANYVVPQGYDVDPKQLAVHQAAVNYQEKNGGADKVDYITAVQVVNQQ